MAKLQPKKNSDPNIPTHVVTLSEAIDAIARKCIIPDQLMSRIEAYVLSHRPSWDSKSLGNHQINIRLDFLVNLLKDTARQWRATALLHAHLLEAGEKAPEWRNWLATGIATRLDEVDRHRAIKIVEHLARDDEGFLLAHLEGRLEPILKDPDGMPALFAPEDERWAKHLGFPRNKLIDFFYREGIEHDLDRVPDDSSNSNEVEGESTSAGSAFPKSVAIGTTARDQSPQVDGLSTQELAAALADDDNCAYKSRRNWLVYLQGSPPSWAIDPKRGVRLRAGKQGGDASIWHPFNFAITAILKYRRSNADGLSRHQLFRAIDERFRKVDSLRSWRDDWVEWAANEYPRLRAAELDATSKPGDKTQR